MNHIVHLNRSLFNTRSWKAKRDRAE